MAVILDEGSSGWTATEVDPETADPATTGPFPAVLVAEPGPPAEQRLRPADRFASARLLAQVAVVVAAAVLVGILVYFLVRSVAGSDSTTGDEQDSEQGLADIEPGPGGLLDDPVDSTRSGSGRSSSGGDDAGSVSLAAARDGEDPASPTAAPGDSSGDDPAEQDGPPTKGNTPITDAPTTTDPSGATTSTVITTTSAPPTTAPGSTVTSTTVDQTTSQPTTSATLVTTTIRPITTTIPTTSTTMPTTTRPTTATTRPTTTTTAPSTTIPIPVDLISSPTNGASRSWNTPTRFTAKAVAGATRYCWTFSAAGSETRECVPGTGYDLDGEPDLSPGPTTVRAEALDGNGRILATGRLSLSLLATDFIDRPDDGESLRLNRPVRLEADHVPTADQYCWTITQDDRSSGQLCNTTGKLNVQVRGDFEPGPALIQAVARRGSTQIGRQSVKVTFVRRR